MRMLFDLLDRRDRRRFYYLLLVLIMVAAIEMAGIASIMPFMAVVTNPGVIHSNHWLSSIFQGLRFESDQNFLIFLGFSVLALLVGGNLIKAFSTWLTLRYHNELNYLLARRLLARYMSRPYAFFLNRNTSELGKNVLSEVRNVIIGVLSPATIIVSSTLVTIAILTLLIIVDPLIAAAIATVLGGAYTIVYLLVRQKLVVIGREQIKANAEKYKAAAEGLGGIKDLKILGRELTFLNRFSVYAKIHERNNVMAGLMSQIPRYALEIIAFGGILVVVLYLISKGREATNMVPLLALYAFAGYRLMPALQQLFGAFSLLRQSAPSLELLHNDFAVTDNGDNEEIDPELQLTASSSHGICLPFEKKLVLRNISFQYEGATESALNNLNIVIEQNTSVGLVGPSGCGKTTTVDLILGLLKPSKGELLVDNVVLDRKNLSCWQQNLGYVPQQIYISDDTIARNIAFGVPNEEVDMQAVYHAASLANLKDFVEKELPDGFETEIGERGIRLSGGQRQRIGIARALYRDPAVLVMDEATSALDGITEENVMDAVRNLSRKKTIILIAHRLTTVKDCDSIYLLDHGSVVAYGSYEQLKRESKWFRMAAGA